MMFAQSGILSDRLRKIFGSDMTEWPAHRELDAVRTAPEDSYTGRTLGPRYRYVGQHRADPEGAL